MEVIYNFRYSLTRKTVYLLLMFFLLFGFTGMQAQVIRYVKPGGLMGFNYQGPHSWQNNQSYRGLQEAIMASSPGDQIWVAAGVYKSQTDSNQQYGNPDPRLNVFVLKEGVKIYGGFPGQPGQEGDFSVRNPQVLQTILTGDVSGDDGAGWPGYPNYQVHQPPLNNNAYAIFINQGMLTDATVLDGFFFQGANSWNAPAGVRAGAISLKSFANPRIENCVFRQNYNLYFGGAITLFASSPKIKDCYFALNVGTGAAISATANSLINVEGIIAHDNFGGDAGGAIGLFQGAKMDMFNSVFYHNHASIGNRLFVSGSHITQLTAQNVIWWNNGFFDYNTNTINYSQAPGRLFYITGSNPGSGIVKVANSTLYSNGPSYSGPTPNNTTNGNFNVDPGQILEISYSVVEFGWPRGGTGIITADPLFINPPTTFDVGPGSPLVNPNFPQVFFPVPYDINGNPRDNNPDLGAYEYDPSLVGLQAFKADAAVLYPNPASNMLYVQSKRNYQTYEIIDMMGRSLVKASFPIHGINLPNLSNGTYMLRLFESEFSQPETYKFQVF
ncbi:MAG: T9SS type A sorting domain-containing protein [Bacteroidetes bacterium]|nr:T9SS type A sorting domain-containing protein [Bacteroidota bacterium]